MCGVYVTWYKQTYTKTITHKCFSLVTGCPRGWSPYKYKYKKHEELDD